MADPVEYKTDKPEIVGELYPSGLSGSARFDIVAASYRDGVLIADTTTDRRIVCSSASPWIFFSAPGKQNKIGFS